MPEQMKDLFKDVLQRDIYNKAEADIGDAFERVVINFSIMEGTSPRIVFPAIVALAWILRSAMLAVKEAGDEVLYEKICKFVQTIITSKE